MKRQTCYDSKSVKKKFLGGIVKFWTAIYFLHFFVALINSSFQKPNLLSGTGGGKDDFLLELLTRRFLYIADFYSSISIRWSSHRSNWKNGGVKSGDKAALRIHHVKHHNIEKKRPLPSAFTVTFVDKPRNLKDLDLMESQWVKRLCASINIGETILPQIT